MINSKKLYQCDDCGKTAAFTSHREAKLSGWAISRDYRRCYCTKCAPYRRKVGRGGGKRPIKADSGKKLNINDIKAG